MILFKKKFRKLKYNFSKFVEFLALKLGAVRVVSGVANLASKNECSIFFVVFEIWLFSWFFQKYNQKTSIQFILHKKQGNFYAK